MKYLIASFDIKDQIVDFLKLNEDHFEPPLSERIQNKSTVDNISQYVDKVLKYGRIYYCQSSNEIAGVVIIYANDFEFHKAYIPILIVSESFQGRGVAVNLLNHALDYATLQAMKVVEVKTWKSNLAAQKLYAKLDFEATENELEIIFTKYLS